MCKEEYIRTINCECGEWEQFPADMARHSSQTFKHVENLECGEATYKCLCGKLVTSICEIVENEA